MLNCDATLLTLPLCFVEVTLPYRSSTIFRTISDDQAARRKWLLYRANIHEPPPECRTL